MSYGRNALSPFMQGVQAGQYMKAQKRAEEGQAALTAYAFDPSESNFNALAQYNPQFVIQERARRERTEAAARVGAQKRQQEELRTFRQLLEQAGDNPQQAFAAAQSLKIDTSSLPQPGTPEFEPWRQQQLFILDALDKGGDDLPGLAREVMLALPEGQRDPNGVQFRSAFTAALENKYAYATEYTDERGNIRRRSIMNQQQPVNQARSGQNVLQYDAFRGMIEGLGYQKAMAKIQEYAQRGVSVAVSTPEEADMLPPGTPIILPDGSPGVVPQ